ncbi:hypothetical protein CERSUDRAFT_98393 [Gelatoporia subvermispora B]|uniref:Uncharacterized protein n=1 Tax=Ceriporiopsis subvermispora (strain B) TaxID=914234 RepID=M2PC73_CERS8|nr:hypothetical protein CERSUDRAFT_101680 [Gelatoporia subvermispora B]EMD33279.1 hypothetical protein CERSUDRAFT_98393 [Gelatoporia subvermispora B]
MDTYPSFELPVVLSRVGQQAGEPPSKPVSSYIDSSGPRLVDSIASAGADGRRPEAEVAII